MVHKNTPLKEAPSTKIASSEISGDITTLAVAYAGDHSLFLTANENLREANRVPHLGPHLLRHLVNGRQDVVIAMLSRYPDLAYYQGDVADPSGIQFKHINALELALELPVQVEFAFKIYEILCESEKYKQDDAAKEDFAKIFSSKLRDHVAKGNIGLVLDEIWVKEVGGAQRDVPAHIAQEYCHPERPFREVLLDETSLDPINPANLERCLGVHNRETAKAAPWFYLGSYAADSGLGVSFGILRTDRFAEHVEQIGHNKVRGVKFNLAAIRTIDDVRTKDLQQSQENLKHPPAVQVPPSQRIS